MKYLRYALVASLMMFLIGGYMPRIAQKTRDFQEEWEDRINTAKAVRKNWKDLFRVDLARQYYDGIQNPGYPKDEFLTINKIYSHLKAQLPSLYSTDPYFYVRLKRSFKPDPMAIALWDKRGRIRQSYLNYLKEELELKVKARLSIQDAHFAYGVCKVHYKADEVENPDYGQPIYGEENEPLLSDVGEPLIEPETIPINERYCVDRIHPDDFVWDEDAGPLEDDWNWCAQCIRMPYSEAQLDKRFSKAALRALRGKGEEKDQERKDREERKKGSLGNVKGKSERANKQGKPKRPEKDIICMWEIYHLREKKWSVIAENGEIPLVEKQDLPPGTEKHPFAILRFTIRDDSPYPHPPVSPGLDAQKEYNLSRSRLLTHRKRFNRKYEVNMQALQDETEASKLESGDDGTIIKKITGEKVVEPIQDAPLDQQTTYMEFGVLDNEMIELLGGAHAESRGIAKSETATQAGILEKRLDIKEGDALSMVVDFVKCIARKLDMLVQTHISRDEAVKITGPQGEFWELVRPGDYEDIQGEYEYGVNVGATVPQLPSFERTSLIGLLGLSFNFPYIWKARRTMKKLFELHHIEDEAMLQELSQLADMVMSGQIAPPGRTGSQAGNSEMRPATIMGGQMGGGIGGGVNV